MDQPSTNPTPPTPSADAADLAAGALKAAQQAVSNLQQETGAPASVGDPLSAAQAAIAHAKAANAPGAQGVQPLNMPAFTPQGGGAKPEGIDLLADVNLHVKIELGRTRMLVEDVLRLGEGSVVELDKLAGDPVDVYVNDRHVAKGEVLVLNDNFCVRINEIVAAVGDQPVSR